MGSWFWPWFYTGLTKPTPICFSFVSPTEFWPSFLHTSQKKITTFADGMVFWVGLHPKMFFFTLLVLIHFIFVSFTNYSFIGFDFGIWFPTSQPAWTETDGGTRVQVLSQTTAPLATVQKLYRFNCSLLYSVQPLQLQYYVSNVPNNVIIR